MNRNRNYNQLIRSTAVIFGALCLTGSLFAEVTPRPLLDLSSESELSRMKTENGASISLVDADGTPALQLSFPKTSGYPGVDIVPPEGKWDLPAYRGVEAIIINKGSKKIGAGIRVDNPGDWRKSPWNSQTLWLNPGATGTIRLNFGESWGKPGYDLDASNISNIKFLINTPSSEGSIYIQSLKAVGTPSEKTDSSTQPSAKGENLNAPSIEGNILPLSKGMDLSKIKKHYTKVSIDEKDGEPVLNVFFNSGTAYPNIQFPVPSGGWNMQAFGGIQVEVTNIGDNTVRAALRADNPGDWRKEPWNTQAELVKPGETKLIQLVFGENNGAPGFQLNPTRVTAIQLFLEHPKANTNLLVRGLKGFGSGKEKSSAFSSPEDRDKPVQRAEWVGKRPPVEGDWVQTLDENFDGDELNTDIWTPRLVWDGPARGELQRYVEENVTVSNGVMNIRAEKEKGHQYNNPNLETREYTTGAVTTLGKWTQKYGYFEAKIKLPTARGLWPAFWTMPDRGVDSGLDIWARRDTIEKHGKGMEMDIFEHLTEWGPGRTNIAAHWGGYGSGHQRWGTSHVYYGPTEDGWHVAGMLWEPGKLSWYIDGIKKGEWVNDRICDVPSYLKFTIQMGNWATRNVDDASLPDDFQIDYVRAWQLKERM